MKRILTLSLFFLFCLTSFAQRNHPLPRGFAKGEKKLMKRYIKEIQSRRSNVCSLDPPQSTSIRSMAEWEELQALVIAWTSFPEILAEIVRHAKEEVEVIIVTTNPTGVQSYLANQGIDWSTNVSFVNDQYDSIWIRDYGPNTVYLDDVGELAIVDWIYNRPRPLDDQIPEAISDFLNIPMYCTTTPPNDLVHTGGNYMSDGLGNGFSSTLVLEENDNSNQWGTSNHSEEDVEAIMNDYMGIDTYIKMETLPWDIIHHIDMHMKIVDEETLIVGQYPEGIADGPQIEANIQFILDNFTTAYGKPFKVVRMPMPPDANGDYPDYPGNSWWLAGDYRTYTNAVFVNETILVPVYEEQYDTTALRIWEETMPGYNIIGIDCNEIIPLAGAIHCITKEVGAENPIWISMEKPDEICPDENTNIEAQILHSQGVLEATLYYTTDLNAGYTSIPMFQGFNPDLWLATIPAPGAADKLYYYIEASSGNKTITRPLVAPEGYFTAEISENCLVSTEEVCDREIKLETVFPNPASAITCIPINSSINTKGRITLIDVLGQEVKTIFDGNIPAGESKYFLHANEFVSGTYLLKFETKEYTTSQKLIIK